jgi:hypothetical protein
MRSPELRQDAKYPRPSREAVKECNPRRKPWVVGDERNNRRRKPRSILSEVIGIDLFHLIGRDRRHPYSVLNEEVGERGAVDQDDLVLDFSYIVMRGL